MRCMLGFSCSICAPNGNISQHEAYSPLAISFSHRAKVTWLTTVSHLTMQKDYQFVGLLSGGKASPLSLLFNRPFITKGCRLEGCVPFVIQCVKCCSHSHCCPDAHLITPVENCTGTLSGSSPKMGLSPPPTHPFSPSLLQQWIFTLRASKSYSLLPLSSLWTSFSSTTVK